MKRLFIIHGWWPGKPTEPWYLWLKQQMEDRGFKVEIPSMPHPKNPTIEDWVKHLEDVVGTPDAQTLFVGHSVGSQTILRYVERVNHPVGGAVFVAGWISKLLPAAIEDEEDARIAAPWLNTPIDWEKLKPLIPRSTAIFSADDYYVPTDNSRIFQEKFGSKIIIEQGQGHYYDTDGVREVSAVLEELVDMS